MVNPKYTPDRGDLVWVNFNPTRGHEQKGKRPTLVISPKSYNHASGLMLACPITSREKGYPFEVSVKGKVSGAVIVDQMRSLDWNERRIKKIGKVHPGAYADVEEKLKLLILE